MGEWQGSEGFGMITAHADAAMRGLTKEERRDFLEELILHFQAQLDVVNEVLRAEDEAHG